MARYRRVYGDEPVVREAFDDVDVVQDDGGTTAIIAVRRMGSALAPDFRGGERVAPATRQPEQVATIVAELGASATAGSVDAAIRDADALGDRRPPRVARGHSGRQPVQPVRHRPGRRFRADEACAAGTRQPAESAAR